jgi:hypothetical protein
MNVIIGNETAQFHFWEYINRIFGTVQDIRLQEWVDGTKGCQVVKMS